MLNNVVLIGRLTADPELIRLSEGSAVLNFSIALNRQYAKEETTDYIDCTAWNKTAELMEQYLGKGSLIAVEGRLQQDRYKTTDGANRSQIKVVCENVQFLESKARAEERIASQNNVAPKQEQNTASELETSSKQEVVDEAEDEELPW